jgi:hypothetical protein
MLTIDRMDMTPEATTVATDDPNAGVAGVALVPISPAPQHGPASSRTPRPDPSFLAQLIATAEHLPQTRRLCRAAPQEALSAYGAQPAPVRRAGRQTGQVI